MQTVINDISDIYRGSEYDLPTLPNGNPVRILVEKELADDIAESVKIARSGDTDMFSRNRILALRDSLQVVEGVWINSFAAWSSRKGKVVGLSGCSEIGHRICREMGFTVTEAEDILSKTKWDRPQEDTPGLY